MRRLFLPVLIVFAAWSYAAAAATPSAYFADVTVDVTADNAATARERAMQQANRQAVTAIAANFTTREGLGVLNKLSNDQLLNFIKETTVLEEKASNVRYLAKLRITANDRLLRQYLQEKNVPLVVASSADVMIVPVFREAEGMPARLWAEDNLPSLTGERALDPNPAILQQIAEINGGGDVYVVEANYNGANGLTVKVLNPRTGKKDIFNVDGPLSDELYLQAARETALHISDELKGRSIVTSTEPETATVLYKFTTLSSWLKIEEKIAAVTAVDNIRINAIGNGRIQFQIDYIGGMDTLKKALQNERLLLTETGNYYTLINM